MAIIYSIIGYVTSGLKWLLLALTVLLMWFRYTALNYYYWKDQVDELLVQVRELEEKLAHERNSNAELLVRISELEKKLAHERNSNVNVRVLSTYGDVRPELDGLLKACHEAFFTGNDTKQLLIRVIKLKTDFNNVQNCLAALDARLADWDGRLNGAYYSGMALINLLDLYEEHRQRVKGIIQNLHQILHEE